MATILIPPTYTKFTTSLVGLRTNALRFPGVVRAGGQTLEIPVDLWEFQASTPKLTVEDAANWRTFFAQLRGPGGRFYFGDPDNQTQRGVLGGTPLVKGASQTGNSVNIDGASASVENWMRKGDYFAIDVPSGHRELKMVTADADTDSLGEVTLTFTPPFRESPADNAAIITTNPTTVVQLTGEYTPWSGDRNKRIQVSFSAIEAVKIPS